MAPSFVSFLSVLELRTIEAIIDGIEEAEALLGHFEDQEVHCVVSKENGRACGVAVADASLSNP
jgi:hypothetical protein